MQFWVVATKAPGVAHLFGECHSCHAPVSANDRMCKECGAGFVVESDRQFLGLASVHLLPGQASPEQIADQSGPRASGERAERDEAPASESAASAVPIEGVDALEAEPPVEPARTGRPARVVGRVALLIGVVGVCAGAAWLAVDRGVIREHVFDARGGDADASAVAPEAVEVEQVSGAESADVSEGGVEADAALTDASAIGEDAIVNLLREGRVEAAVQAAGELDGAGSYAAQAAFDRATRDRIAAFLLP
jgi:hypothetical protein